MQKIFFLHTLFTLCFIHLSLAQNYNIPPDYFRSPLDIPLYLSGTFGEPRTTHFHTGIDIKTAGVQGKNIYAVADGYISRVNVSPYGYGNALYITHPNGYVSVYAHLKNFKKDIENWLKEQQIDETSFAVNLESLPPNLFPVKKGDIIAHSGNSGGSGGPHLHFEIRDSLEHPINPLYFGYDLQVKDNAKPNIYNIFFYNIDEAGNPLSNKKVTATNLGYGTYKISNTQNVNTSKLGIGVHTVDLFTGTSNKNGVFEIKMFVNDTLHYHYRVDELDFNFTKHVYSHCDYWAKRSNNNTVHKCFVEKGNKLKVYPELVNQGIINLEDNKPKNISVEVLDFHGNKSTINFSVAKDLNTTYFINSTTDFQFDFKQSDSNAIQYNDFRLILPKDVLFTDLKFQFSREGQGKYSQIYKVHDAKVPVAGYFDISILPTNIDTTKLDKYYIAYNDYNGRKRYAGGTFRNGYLNTKSRALGTYFIDIDEDAPVVKVANIYNNKKMTNFSTIQFTASDATSGIAEYNLFINGNWAVLEYDAKRNLFTYYIDDLVKQGSNDLELIILDDRSNATVVNYTFTY
ncbi:MAG: M23 family metallopeptidase [Bacteroidetes bacterium]|nr:M23 family metallopeptidase [Bacteroidota bacterium]